MSWLSGADVGAGPEPWHATPGPIVSTDVAVGALADVPVATTDDGPVRPYGTELGRWASVVVEMRWHTEASGWSAWEEIGATPVPRIAEMAQARITMRRGAGWVGLALDQLVLVAET